MSIPLEFARDVASFNTFAMPFSDTVFRTTLAAGVAQSLTIPSNPDPIYKKWLAIFSIDPGKRIFIGNGVVSSVPGGSFDESAAPLNPTPRIVKSGDILSFITPDTNAYVTVELYAIQ